MSKNINQVKKLEGISEWQNFLMDMQIPIPSTEEKQNSDISTMKTPKKKSSRSTPLENVPAVTPVAGKRRSSVTTAENERIEEVSN